MNRRKWFWGGAAAAVLMLAVAAAGVWYAVLREPAPEQVSLQGAVASVTAKGAAATPGSDLTGVWTVAAGTNSFAGYRVKEELARIGATTAVGRTTALAGSLRFDGSAITEVQVTADLTALKSDSSMRDGALRMQALETAKFPSATFRLTQPIPISASPAEGTKLSAMALGELTLHGVTRQLSIPLEGQFIGGQVVVVGSAEIVFADYGIAQPRGASVLSIEDRGILELQLVFERAGTQS